MSGPAHTVNLVLVKELLGVHARLVAKLENRGSDYYSAYIIPKYYERHYVTDRHGVQGGIVWNGRCRGGRLIEEPCEPLKSLQHVLAQILRFPVHHKATGYVQNCGILDNAMHHIAASHVLNIDFESFYGSISYDHLLKLFSSNGLEEEADKLLALVTYEGRLPHGSPTSPGLSNAVCYQLDEELNVYADMRGLRYSRYVDDITFSSQEYIEPSVLDEIKQMVSQHGFTLNDRKTRFISQSKAMTVTGLVINHDPFTHQYVPRVPRKTMRKIRAMIHQDLWYHDELQPRTKGYCAWVKGINPDQSKQIDRWRLNAAVRQYSSVEGLEDDDLPF